MLTVVFCADPLRPARVDPHFARQAAAVGELGGTVALIDHDALVSGDTPAAVRRVPRDAGPVWYRGWMVTADDYAELDTALAARGTHLVTGADRYRAAHELPGWYDVFAEVTPESTWLPRPPGHALSTAEVEKLVEPLGAGPGIVKDYVKSRKHEWAEACYLPDLADLDAVARVIGRMVEL
ncbi:hypothetical protein F4553_001116 [Allocatelliglobosispora scoriae]|uniref:ATP-grasp domain-containing protein n=1 Tax=Allocatelliglobosispora scoriae TaxID=643052 RepID=A0A841BF73_9ACTN|nr:ATP-grasp domain-containing protein [Allocatelliglobosispora scoriae]MBB5867737.1 hypothetical protein [Allocatelliglobosispora scoriae]